MRSRSSRVGPRRSLPRAVRSFSRLTPAKRRACSARSRTTVERDRAGAVRELADRARATVVLKGARTIVAGSAGRSHQHHRQSRARDCGRWRRARGDHRRIRLRHVARARCVGGGARPRPGRRLVAGSPRRRRSRASRQRGCRRGARGPCRAGTRDRSADSLTRRCVSSAATGRLDFQLLAALPGMAPDLRKQMVQEDTMTVSLPVARSRAKPRAGRERAARAPAAYLPDLYSRALRLSRNDAVAQDVLQDTFERALRFEGQYEPGSNLRAWLQRILLSVFITRCRRPRRERRALENLTHDPCAWTLPDAREGSQSLSPPLQRALACASRELSPGGRAGRRRRPFVPRRRRDHRRSSGHGDVAPAPRSAHARRSRSRAHPRQLPSCPKLRDDASLLLLRVPRHVGHARHVVGAPREREEQIGQTIQIDDDLFSHLASALSAITSRSARRITHRAT